MNENDSIRDEGSVWLSILAPAFNVENYISEFLESILDQQLDGVEVLIYDDGSTDGTLRVLHDYLVPFAGRLKVIEGGGNGGVSHARNHLLQAASGMYIWHVDSDDRLIVGAVAAARRILKRNGPDFFMFSYKVWRDSYTERQLARGEMHRFSFYGWMNTVHHSVDALVGGIYDASQFHTWSKIVKRSVWERSGLRFPVGRLFEDTTLTPCVALYARSYYYYPEVLIGYRQRAGSILSVKSARSSIDMMNAFADFPREVRRSGVSLSRRSYSRFLVAAAQHFKGAFRDLRGLRDASLQDYEKCLSLLLEAADGRLIRIVGAYLYLKQYRACASFLNRVLKIRLRRLAPVDPVAEHERARS